MIEFPDYENCWFEIRTMDTSIVTRNEGVFLRKSQALSKLNDITLYKIEKSNSGMKKSRLHLLG